MDYKLALAVFASVFIAELGDKTQLATLLFACGKESSRLTVFIGASLALVASTAIAVLASTLIAQYLDTRQINYIAGFGFIAIGLWTLLNA